MKNVISWCFTHIHISTLWNHGEKSQARIIFIRNTLLVLYINHFKIIMSPLRTKGDIKDLTPVRGQDGKISDTQGKDFWSPMKLRRVGDQ